MLVRFYGALNEVQDANIDLVCPRLGGRGRRGVLWGSAPYIHIR